MLLIDGVKYELWTPPNEDEFEQLIKEHTKDIFGEESIYFDRKQKLKSLSGIGSIPDGYAISLQGTPCWYICEVELHTHPLYEHIVPQMTKFINGVKSLSSQRELVNAFYGGLNSDLPNEALVRSKIGPTEVYHFISDLISKPPILVIVINQKTRELEEVCDSLPIEVKIIEFQTFTREGVGLQVHAHLFEPLCKIAEKKSERVNETKETITCIQREESGVPEIKVKITPASIKYGYIPFPKRNRLLFPGYDAPFTLVTDIGEITPHVTGARVGTQVGDLNAGNRIGKNLKPWYKNHRELQLGDELIIKIIEPMKKYRLEIVK